MFGTERRFVKYFSHFLLGIPVFFLFLASFELSTFQLIFTLFLRLQVFPFHWLVIFVVSVYGCY